MKNYIQDGDTLTVPAPSGGTISGKFVIIGSLIGIAAKTVDAGNNVAVATYGVYKYAKTASLAVAVGDKLYYDATNNVLNKTSSGNTLVGIAVEASATSDTTVKVKLGAPTV